MLRDMMEWLGWERRGGEHGVVMVAGMVLTLTMEGQGKGCSGLYWCPGVW
jgi:hypothetical protein